MDVVAVEYINRGPKSCSAARTVDSALWRGWRRMKHLAFKVDNATVVPGSACPERGQALPSVRRCGMAGSLNQRLAFRHEQRVLLVTFASTLLVHRVGTNTVNAGS